LFQAFGHAMQDVTQDVRQVEIERLIRALQTHVDAGAVPNVLRHLTDQLEKQAEVEQRFAELFESEQIARSEAREQRQANATKDRFLAILSHELRMPLQPVLATASALLRDPRLPADLLDEVRTIQRNVQLEARLIDDLLDLTRMTHGKLALEPAPMNMHSVISRAIDICEPDVIAKQMTFSLRLEATRPWVTGDPGRLQQVMWNLIKNAVKFTQPRGTITVQTSDGPDQKLVVRVIDNGIGIDPDTLPRIFDAFEQADEQITRQFGGLGLGLAISKMLVDRHDGTLTAYSDGKMSGATFTLTLRSIDEPKVAPRPPRAGLLTTQAPPRVLRVALVEDDEATATIISKLLRSLGHTVEVVGDCAAATALADQNASLDLLLCDIALPDGSGLDVIHRFKRRGIKSIALTGYGSEADVRSSLDAGFDLHLTKPVTFGEIVAAIDRLFP
jgi:signal transduction histidine kinase